MRMFEIFNSTRRARESLAVLYCNEPSTAGERGEMRIVINPAASSDDLPFMLSLFVQRGQFELSDEWAHRWVAERVPPQGRQNLGEVLRANGLEEYDEVALLAAAEGRSSQDDCLLREVPPRVDYAFVSMGEDDADGRPKQKPGWCSVLGPQIAEHRKQAGMTQRDLAEKTGVDQAAISRIEQGRANPTLNTLESLVEGVGSSLLVRIV